METLIALMQNYGYLFVFIATVAEGETVVTLAGFMAFQGYLDLSVVIPVAILGAVIGDQAFFYFGRLKGRGFIAARPKLSSRVERIHRLIERHQNLLIFGSRFVYGFRTIIPISIGTSKVSELRFLILNVFGAIVWGTFFAGGGYLFGTVLEGYIGQIHHAEKYIIIGVIIGATLVHAVGFIYRRIAARVENEELREEKEGGMDNQHHLQSPN